MQAVQQELEMAYQKFRQVKEEVAEKDGQIQIISMNLQSCEKQRNFLTDEVTWIHKK